MDNDATIGAVMEAIEIADRVEKLKDFVRSNMKNKQCREGAMTYVAVDPVNDIQDYFHYQQISKILYCITKQDKDWTVGRCCGEIFAELRQ